MTTKERRYAVYGVDVNIAEEPLGGYVSYEDYLLAIETISALVSRLKDGYGDDLDGIDLCAEPIK